MNKPGYSLPSGAYRRPNNFEPYPQGRADQRKRDWPVIAACLLVLVIYIIWSE